jgi:hypothetical protein
MRFAAVLAVLFGKRVIVGHPPPRIKTAQA